MGVRLSARARVRARVWDFGLRVGGRIEGFGLGLGFGFMVGV